MDAREQAGQIGCVENANNSARFMRIPLYAAA